MMACRVLCLSGACLSGNGAHEHGMIFELEDRGGGEQTATRCENEVYLYEQALSGSDGSHGYLFCQITALPYA